MYQFLLKTLLQKAIIDDEVANRIGQFEKDKPFSLHWELNSMLYFGVLLLNVGLGVLIYENIDSIGHIALITAIGAVSLGCFWYAYTHRAPFSSGETKSPTPYYDYILLLGCLTFLIMEGYWQYQYNIFGDRYGLVTFIPMVLFFSLAYFFDNRGVLALGITALAAWVGITVTPLELLKANDFNSETIVITSVGLGIVFIAVPFISERFRFKKHFSLTYLNFGVHLLLVACLAGMIALDREILYFPLLCIGVVFFLWYARENASFYFLTVSIIYGYIGITHVIFNHTGHWIFEGYLFYLVATCGGIIAFFLNYKKFFKSDNL